jgi:hypothetical protein
MTQIDDPRTAKVEHFLSELTELSDKYGIAITGKPVLFLMEKEDYAFAYRADDESNLSLG